ncbi:DUF2218 domain-containing protein [Hyphomicrobium sp.]|uniref:DUF2218 domain-containing protein n=1 Tax=Hyphomicrobium sp. TaxID=82 RepID=UPI0025B90474|nr:DUF2218 domain-containing protein [Hyphomicrobium sp.]MCC7250639.1 DUF2218 domain-containing protein [Hyphomicrobium sp.]
MLRATSSFETERASRYLQAMCRHFAHKVPVNYDASVGTADMPFGLLNMEAAGNTLRFEIEAADDQSLARLKYVVEAHIVRFAFREKLKKLDWY